MYNSRLLMKKNNLEGNRELTDDEMAKKINDEIVANVPISIHFDFDKAIQTSVYKDGRMVNESIEDGNFKIEIKKNTQ